MIVDAQIHIWGADSPGRPWPRAGAEGRTATPQRPIPLGAEEILREMDQAGVERAVLVPPSWEGDRNDLALTAANLWPDRFAVMGRIDPAVPDLAERLARWRDQPGMIGLRFILASGAGWLEQEEGARLWSLAERHDLPLMVAPSGRIDLLARVARHFPRLRIVVDHMGAHVGRTGSEAFTGLPALIALADCANVAVKATGVPCYSADGYPWADVIDGPLKYLHARFGAERIFWGSDLSRLKRPYRELVALFRTGIDWLPDEDRRRMLGPGLLRWLGWR